MRRAPPAVPKSCMPQFITRWLKPRTADWVSDLLWWLIHGGALVIMVLPLMVGSQFFFPFIVLKNVLFRFVAEGMLVAYVALALRDPRYRPTWNALTVSGLVFFAVATLTSFTGVDPVGSFWGNFERMGGVIGLLHVAAFFFVLANTLRQWDDWCTVASFSIFISVVMSLFAFAQWQQVPFLLRSSGGARLTATIGNATYLAGYLLFHLSFLAYFIVRPREFKARLFCGGVLGLLVFFFLYDLWVRRDPAVTGLFAQLADAPVMLAALLALLGSAILVASLRWHQNAIRCLLVSGLALNLTIFYQTQTRGAIIGLVVGVIMAAAVIGMVRWRTAAGKASLGVVALCLAAPVLLFAARDSAFVKGDATLKRLASISLRDVTSQSRLDTWRASGRGWGEDPVRFLIGYGQENYAYVFNRHFPPSIFKDAGSQIWFDRAHNIFFEIAVTTGLIGLASYLAMFGSAAWLLVGYYRRTRDLLGVVFPLAALLAYVVQNLFVFDTLESYVLSSLVFAGIVSRASSAAGPIPPQSGAPKPYAPAHLVVVIGLVAAFALSSYALQYQLLAANHKIYQALLEFSTPDPVRQRQLFHEAIRGTFTGRIEARQQYATYALGLVSKELVPRETVSDLLRDALAELKKSVAEQPSNIRNHLFFASVANRADVVLDGTAEEAIDVLLPAVSMSSTRPQVYFELGQAYLILGQEEPALEYFRKGLEYSAHVVESHVDVAVAYALMGRTAEAGRQMEIAAERFGGALTPGHFLRVIRAAESTSRFPLAIQLYQMLIVREVKPDYFASLAVDYAKIGDKAQAIEAATRALQLEPNLQGQFDAFMEKLDEILQDQ